MKAKTKPHSRTSWQEKLHRNNGLPKKGRVEGKMTQRWGTGTLVIPAPLEVDALMRQVPRGRLTTINELRAALARRHEVDLACPITTGIFAWIAAHAAAEAEAAKQKGATPTPYWRTLKTGGELNPKYPGGIALLKKRLTAEGHTVTQKGTRFFVKDFDQRLAQLGD